MCRSTSIILRRARGDAPAPCGSRRRGRNRLVDLLELVDHARHGQRRAEVLRGRHQPFAQLAVFDQARELRGQRVDVARLEQQPAVPVGEQLLVDRQARGERATARAPIVCAVRGPARAARRPEASTTTSARRSDLLARRRRGRPGSATRVAQVGPQRGLAPAGPTGPSTVASHSSAVAEPRAARAGRCAARRAPPPPTKAMPQPCEPAIAGPAPGRRDAIGGTTRYSAGKWARISAAVAA